jgi:hypothetical protein
MTSALGEWFAHRLKRATEQNLSSTEMGLLLSFRK